MTAEISKATFGMTPSEYKKYKGLGQENLRDHMTDLELIFSMLGEAATKEIAVNRNAQGFSANAAAAKAGGKIAGDARRELEQESGKPVISKENYRENLTPVSVETGGEMRQIMLQKCSTSQLKMTKIDNSQRVYSKTVGRENEEK